MTIKILQGNCLDVLATLPAESVHCVVTSPPYWGLRDYGVKGQLGLEPTLAEHLETMVEVFREVRRVLRKDGTLWLNYGDVMAGSWGAQGHRETAATISRNSIKNHPKFASHTGKIRDAGLKPKDLCMVSNRLAIALQDAGWWVRSEIIWAKPNPMPESAKDRPTNSHEKVWLLSKSPRYFYDQEAVREQDGGKPSRNGYKRPHRLSYGDRGQEEQWEPGGGHNLRNVWTIATHPYPEAHFATFPPALVERCVKAGTSAKGVCGDCGAPWAREVDVSYVKSPVHGEGSVVGRHEATGQNNFDGAGMPRLNKETKTTGWRPSCGCDADVVPATVLDPFGGSGTTGLVADRLQRNAILIDLNTEYIQLAVDRIKDDAPLFADVSA